MASGLPLLTYSNLGTIIILFFIVCECVLFALCLDVCYAFCCAWFIAALLELFFVFVTRRQGAYDARKQIWAWRCPGLQMVRS